MFYDYADSGSWTESTYRANESDFQKIKFRQRVAVNMENRTTKTLMVGQEVTMPVALAPTGLTGMQENHTDAIFAGWRQGHPLLTHLFAIELIWNLYQYTCAIAYQWVSTYGTTVINIFKNLQPLADDVMRLSTFDVGNKTHATSVVFVRWVV